MDEQEEKNQASAFEKQSYSKASSKLDDIQRKSKKAKKIVKFIKAKKLIIPLLIILGVIIFIVFWGGIVSLFYNLAINSTNTAKKSAISVSYSSDSSTSPDTGTNNDVSVANTSRIVVKPAKNKNAYEISNNYTDEEIKELRENLENETSRSLDDFSDFEIAIIGALAENGLDIDDWNLSELKCFPAFIKAEACTQYLDLRSNGEKFNGKENTIENYKPLSLDDLESKGEEYVPGCILVQRTNAHNDVDGEEPITLEYIEESTFNKLYDENKNEILNYFTLNNNGDLIIAVLEKEEEITVNVEGEGLPADLQNEVKSIETDGVQYTYNKEKVPYSDYMNDFVMPFELLVQLLAITEDPEFCMDLANCALESKIVINIQEEETYTHSIETRNYTIHNKNSKEIDYNICNIVAIEANESYLLQNGEYYGNDGVDDEGNNCTNYYEPDTVEVTIDTEETETSFSLQIPIYVDFWMWEGKTTYGDSIKEETETEQNPDKEEGKYKEIEKTTVTDATETIKDQNVKSFKEKKEKAYESKIIIPTVKTTQNKEWTIETINGVEVPVYKTISCTISFEPESTVKSTTPGTLTYYADENGNITLPSSITIYTNSIEHDETIETERIPEIPITYTLNNGNYTTTTTKEDIVKCIVTRLQTKKEQKVDVDASIKTTEIQYKSGAPISQTILHDKKDEKFLEAYGNSKRAQHMMKSVASWLWETMEEDEVTVDFIRWIKYFLYKFDGTDYGVTEISLDGLFEGSNINTFDTSIYGESIQEKVWYALKDLGYSDISIAAAMGNIHYESETFDPSKIEGGYNENNGGIGICQWTNFERGSKGRNTNLKNYAKSKGKTWKDEDIQVEFLVGELTKGGGADGYATYQLLNTDYTGTVYYYKDWSEAKDSEELDKNKLNELTEVFCFTFERPNASDGYSSMSTRQKYALQYYNQFHGKERSGGTFIKSKEKGIVGTFTSAITGKTFTILDQTNISGWGNFCNKCVAVCIASGYSNDQITTLRSRALERESIMSNMQNTNWYFNKYGLTAKSGSYSIKNIRSALTSGQYIGIRFSSYAYGKSGQDYASSYGHWIGIIGYKKENGKEQIFISDSAHGSTGWHDIDEFESSSCKRTLQYFTVVSVK